jgi:hypothetical protein
MKTLVMSTLTVFALASCAPGTTPTRSTGSSAPNSSSTNQSISPEAEAKAKTQRMKTVLGLSAEQESKVMLANTVNIKLVRSLRDSNQTDKLAATRESYFQELQSILTPEQFAKYKQEFEGM